MASLHRPASVCVSGCHLHHSTDELDLQILWLRESRRIAFGVAARTSMGAILDDEDIEEYLEIFNDVIVIGAPVWHLLPPECHCHQMHGPVLLAATSHHL